MTGTRPSLAVWQLASCDGCQLTLLDCEDELLAVAGAGPNVAALTAQLRRLGMTEPELGRVFATFNAAAPANVAARHRDQPQPRRHAS